MSMDLIITLVGLSVAGLAAVLGIWVERDKTKPPRYAYALSILILMATAVGMFQTYMDAMQGDQMQADMARMLQMLEKVSSNSEVEIPELQQFVQAELATQSRANPKVVEKFAQRVVDEGGDPGEVLSKHLPAADVESIQRKGTLSKVKPPSAPAAGATVAAAGGPAKKPMLLIKPRNAPTGDPAPQVAAAAPTAAPTAEPTAVPEIKPAPSLSPKAFGLGMGGKPAGTAKPDAKPAEGAPKPPLKPRL
jgi:hypothetical protein